MPPVRTEIGLRNHSLVESLHAAVAQQARLETIRELPAYGGHRFRHREIGPMAGIGGPKEKPFQVDDLEGLILVAGIGFEPMTFRL